MLRTSALLFATLLVAAGCNDTRPTPAQPSSSRTGTRTAGSEAEEIKANLAKLSPEDRALAEQQKYCAVQTESRLGSMGVPIKVLVKDQPVFVCCKGCDKTALKDPDKTLRTVKELKEKIANEGR
jgi:hypothetical protein